MPYQIISPRTIGVTRHSGLVEFLREEGLIEATTEVVAHATPEVVKGCRVIGILPLNLAALAACVEQPVLDLPPELRGKELTAASLRQYFKGFETFVVHTTKEMARALRESNENGHQGYGRTLGKWEEREEFVLPIPTAADWNRQNIADGMAS